MSFLKNHLLRIYNYHLWANDRLIQHIKTLPEGVLRTKVENVFPTIAETFGHMIAADETWYLRMKGKGENIQAITPKSIHTVEEIAEVSADLYEEIGYFLLQVNTEEFITYQNTRGEQFTNKISEIVQHMVNHGTYHRGNIAAMIRQMWYRGISTDYIQYARNP